MPPPRKSAYQLSQSQVSTPASIVGLFWRILREIKRECGKVLDLGAGDCRFAKGGTYQSYVGIEIDKSRCKNALKAPNLELIQTCAFKHAINDYDACIGNPPYVRHHDIDSPWKERTVSRLEREMGVKLNRHCNLYIYFMCLGLLRTKAGGVLAMIVPYEWVSRPSALPIRKYIQQHRWNVRVYRFQASIFDGVMTTACITIVDKSKSDDEWSYFLIDEKNQIHKRNGATDAPEVLRYSNRKGWVWTMRGLSPGSQQVFTLTEGERVHYGLSLKDVKPCVTTLRGFPRDVGSLNKASFKKYFVEAGFRCWLIKSWSENLSPELRAYLTSVPRQLRDTYTCKNQTPWYNFKPHPVPQLLVSSGFTSFGPKVLINSIGASAVGSVFGIHGKKRLPLRRLAEYLRAINFEKQIVAHALKLKKVEVKQYNTALSEFQSITYGNGPH